ncbi:hypothetical protein [Kosakonia cowanii]|uniref:hypothetical protein n=1 Tax=Kosakonia cowanii TaxID=208223 RepID=UPI004062F3F5
MTNNDELARNPVLAYADSYRSMANQGSECVPVWGVITDLDRNIAPLYTALLAERDADKKRIAELEAREVKPVAWMRSANVTSFMSRFTTDEKYAVEQWGDDAVALYPLAVAFIPACFTDERNLMHINERGRQTSLIWSKQNSDSGDIKLFRIAAAASKGE